MLISPPAALTSTPIMKSPLSQSGLFAFLGLLERNGLNNVAVNAVIRNDSVQNY